jgi:hypothetical protein
MFIGSVNLVNAQSTTNSTTSQDLYKEIAHMDSMLFNAFNSRDIEKTKTFFSTDVEFFHDKAGLADYTKTIENTKVLFERNDGLKRQLVAGSMEVYPIPGYGAIQTGMHRFCHVENGKDDCGTFKFVHIWQKKDNVWKLTRVISYDHK